MTHISYTINFNIIIVALKQLQKINLLVFGKVNKTFILDFIVTSKLKKNGSSCVPDQILPLGLVKMAKCGNSCQIFRLTLLQFCTLDVVKGSLKSQVGSKF